MLLHFRYLLAGVVLLGLSFSLQADEPAKDPKAKPKHTNRLARESSPYLLQHAHNPVDWYPWGEEAFARAKKEGKLVFLSIGYSSCHWCHVMEKESFDNEEVAKLLNQHFVCIKVDREERPDIDHIYMTVLSVLDQPGGWPLSMFLTAEGKPVIGGTYWPREDRMVGEKKVFGFKSLLKLVADAYKKSPKEIGEDANKLAEATAEALAGTARGLALIDLNRDLVTNVVDELKEQFDPVHGGFGSPTRQFKGTKFPTPPRLLFLQEEAARTKSKELAKILEVTLDHMARGGIYDHLGGGFHRYSTERTWTVPHFEKMLYDNAQLVEVYARAYRNSKNPMYARVVRETLAFVDRELTSPEGAFYSALDADSEGEEGKYYVWTTQELTELIPDKETQELFRQVYGADKGVNFEDKYRILLLPRSLAAQAAERKLTEEQLLAKLAPVKARLLAVRSKRARPFLDTKVLTAWNGQMIAGYALAGAALGEKKYLDTAARAADFLLKHLRTREGRLLRTYSAAPGKKAEAKLNAYLDDYAFLVHGLLCLHEATNDKKWLDEARQLTDTMLKFHGDPRVGAFYYTSSDHEKFFARAKDQFDGAQPSGNSVAAQNLVRLWVKTGDARYRDQAEKCFKALAGPLKSSPSGLTGLASGLALFLDAPKKK